MAKGKAGAFKKMVGAKLPMMSGAKMMSSGRPNGAFPVKKQVGKGGKGSCK